MRRTTSACVSRLLHARAATPAAAPATRATQKELREPRPSARPTAHSTTWHVSIMPLTVDGALAADEPLKKKEKKKKVKTPPADSEAKAQDSAARQAATEAFLAAREQEAAAKAEAKAAAKAAKVAEAEKAAADKLKRKADKRAEKTAKRSRSSDQTGNTSSRSNGSGGKAGDWICQCGAHVFASRSTCYKCGAAAGDESTPAAASGGSGAKPGDWTCACCGANVFASKVACYKCGTPKGEKGTAPPPSSARGAASERHAALAQELGLEDINATCKDCGAGFVVKASEQACFREKGFSVCVRARCSSCTAAKKRGYGDRYGQANQGGGGGDTAGSQDPGPKCFNCARKAASNSTPPPAAFRPLTRLCRVELCRWQDRSHVARVPRGTKGRQVLSVRWRRAHFQGLSERPKGWRLLPLRQAGTHFARLPQC